MGCHFTKNKVIPIRPISELNLSKEELERVTKSIQEPGKTSAQIIKELTDVGIVDPRFASGGIAFNVGDIDPACQRPRRLEKLDLPESTLLKEEKLRMKMHKAQCRRMFKDAERAAKIEERKKLRASAIIKKEAKIKAKEEVNDKVWSLKKPLIVGSLYRPPNSGIPYTEELRNIISSLQSKHKDSTLWIGGDANLPDIDWKSSTVTGHNYLLSINNAFIDLMYDLGSEQIVDFPTRSSNTLDIFVTNRPTLVNKCIPIPGLSDHDIVMVDANIVPARQKPPKRLIYLWKQCNLTDMEQDLHQSVQGFLKVSTTSTPIDSLWASFKSICMTALHKHVPTKLTSGRFSQPWCNRKIRRLARRKQRAFRKAKRTGSNKVWLRYKGLLLKHGTERNTERNGTRNVPYSVVIERNGTRNVPHSV